MGDLIKVFKDALNRYERFTSDNNKFLERYMHHWDKDKEMKLIAWCGVRAEDNGPDWVV